MRQFVLPADWDGSDELRIAGGEARHLVRVLRLGAGDRFPAIDTAGRRHECVLVSVEERAVVLSVRRIVGGDGPGPTVPLEDLRGGRGRRKTRAIEEPRLPNAFRAGGLPRIVLAAALLKGEKFDLVVRQAAEAGVSRVIPLETARSLGRMSGSARRERQLRIVREALQQSGSPVPTGVEDPVELHDLAHRLGEPMGTRLSLLLHETPLADGSLHEYLGPRPEEVVLCVGPEGGFAPDEVDFLLASGYFPFRLPGAVLRAETAALFAVAAVEIVVSEHDPWIRSQA